MVGASWSQAIFAAGTLASPMAPIEQQDGGPLRDLTEVFVKLTRPLEVAAANATISATGGITVAAGYATVAAGCIDPTPFEPLTCIISAPAGALFEGIGFGELGLGGWFFMNITLPAFRNWGGGE